MKKIFVGVALSIIVLIGVFVPNGCVSTRVADKGGAQLWGENCMRCHNSPSPSSFDDVQWDVVAMHMQIRANLTHEETEKIIEFLKSAN